MAYLSRKFLTAWRKPAPAVRPPGFREYPKWLYHHKLARGGRVFEIAEETKGLARQGWVETPAKFPPPPKPSQLKAAFKIGSEWEPAIKLVTAVLALAALLISLHLKFS